MSKSSNSQYLYREVQVDPFVLSTLFLGDEKYNANEVALVEEFKELQDQLLQRVMGVIKTQLTERQREVMIKIYIEQRTQMETAELLGVCQTTVHKILAGNVDYQSVSDDAPALKTTQSEDLSKKYKKGTKGKRYGGALKKIRKLCYDDAEIVELFQKMDEIRSALSEL